MQTEPIDISTALTPGKTSVPDLILHRFRLRAWRRMAWLRRIWQYMTPENAAMGAYHQEADRILLQVDDPAAECRWYEEMESLEAVRQEISRIEDTLAEDQDSRLFLLGQIFGLNEEETDLLQACLAVSLEPELGRICAYLQDQMNRPYVTGELVARLYGHGRHLAISPESPLQIWRLVRETGLSPVEPPCYTLDPGIRDWLIGRNELARELVNICYVQAPQTPLAGWPVAETVQLVKKQISADPPGRIRLQVSGIPGSGRKTFAASVARHLNMPLLAVACDRVPTDRWEDVCIHAYRQAYLDRCALAWTGESLGDRFWPDHLPAFQIQFAICEPGQELRAVPSVTDHLIDLPEPSLEETRDLWRRLLPSSAVWETDQLEVLLRKYNLTVGQIADLAGQGVTGPVEAEARLKAQSRHQLGALAQPLATTFHWDDLVVGPILRQQLRDFVFEAGERRQIWERPEMVRLFPQGRGLFALFTGSPGTGKTMAAQVIAAELDLPLFRIDLSSVVSKYVGETSKNLERILSRAQRMNAVLLFDEADALFGKRTEIRDAHDRFANTDTNYLLQAIEQFPGIAILTSNKKANIDHGFIRRLRYVLDFPRPDAGQRTEIWRRLLGEMAGPDNLQKLNPSLTPLAENLELTGAQIKLALLSAVITARRENEPLNLEHLLQGVEREWMKEGRGISQELRKVMHKRSSNHQAKASNGIER